MTMIQVRDHYGNEYALEGDTAVLVASDLGELARDRTIIAERDVAGYPLASLAGVLSGRRIFVEGQDRDEETGDALWHEHTVIGAG
jgi:hypothetical protein